MNSLNDISCTYILNLDSEKYKYDILKKKLDSFNLDLKIKRFPAIDGNLHKEEFHKLHEIYYKKLSSYTKNLYNKTNNIKNIKKDFSFDGLFRSYGAFGCLLSYIKIFEDAIKNNYDNIFLLQDDIYFHKDFINLANQEILKHKNFNALYLGYNKYILYKSIFIDGLYSVIINKNLFKNILNQLKKKINPADTTIFSIIKKYNKYYTSKIKLVIPDVSKSNTIKRENYMNYYKKINIDFNNYDLTEQYYNNLKFK